jgi:hypothetical protein
MPRACKVCAHAELAEITKALAAGDSIRDVSLRYNLSAASVQRHLVSHMRQQRKAQTPREPSAGAKSDASLRFDSGAAEISSPQDLLARLQSLFRLTSMLETAYESGDVDAAVKVARELRAVAESYARVAGWLSDGANNMIDARRQQIAIFANLSEAELRALAAGGVVADHNIDYETLIESPGAQRGST